MKSAIEIYQDMLLEPAVPTPFFHEVLRTLLEEGASEGVLGHMDDLLHMPNRGPIQWQQNAVQLACRNMIATVTEHEAMEAYLDDESPQEWDTLASRVIEKRKKGVAEGK